MVKQFESELYQFKLICNHKKFKWAQDWIEERMPEMKDKMDLAVLPLLSVIAESSWDIYQIFVVLINSTSEACKSAILTEIMHLIALALLHFHRQHKISSRFHFQVFQGIKWFETDFEFGDEVLFEEKEEKDEEEEEEEEIDEDVIHELTADQARIAYHRFSKKKIKDIIKVEALAGTGKTTSLIKMCENNPKLKFLVVVYNKSVQTHLSKLLPGNSVCMTAHSMAFKEVYNKMRIKTIADLRPKTVIQARLMSEYKPDPADPSIRVSTYFQRVGQVLRTVESFLYSPDDFISFTHVPKHWFHRKENERTLVELSPPHRYVLIAKTKKYFAYHND